MSGRRGETGVGGDEAAVRNWFGGQADGVLQAGQVHGDVHFHGRRRREAPRMVPAPTPHFINQSSVLAKTDEAVAATNAGPRVLVYVGPPGSGKREVARYWLQLHADEYPDGQFHADLSAGLDQTGLESTRLLEFLLAADVDPAAIPDTEEGRASCFRSWSTEKRVAVVVDEALTPRQVRMLAPGTGPSVILVTAAGPLTGLGVRGAATFVDLSPLEDDAALELLRRLAGAERVDREPEAVGELLAMCAGLPIALCVTGAMFAARPNRQIARLVTELSDERRRLAALSRIEDLSVTAVFNTAYRRLTPAARRCYHAFGIHPGAADVGVEALSRAVDLAVSEVDDALGELAAAGLLREIAEDRYLPHTLVRLHARQVAIEREPVESDRMLGRLLEHYRRQAVAAGHAVMPLRGWLETFFASDLGEALPAEPMRWLETERENLLAVVEALFRSGRLDDVCLLAVALWPLHERGKHFDDLVSVNERAVEAAGVLGRADLRALLIIQLGFAHRLRGQARLAYDVLAPAVKAAAATGVVELEATAVESMGLAARDLGRGAEARALLGRNLELAERIGVARRIALARMHLGTVVDPESAVALLRAAHEDFLALDPADDYNAAKTQLWLGRTLTRLRRFADARSQLDDALRFMRDQGMPFDQAHILEALGDLEAALGATGDAADRYRESLAITETCGFSHEAERVRAKLAALAGPDDIDADGGAAQEK